MNIAMTTVSAASQSKIRKISSAHVISSSIKNVTQRKTLDPFEKRLNHIRIHLLNNKIPKRIVYSEPTLVFDKFLYIGGLQSLQDKDKLTRLNITHILSVVRIRPKKSVLPSNVQHLFLEADDSISFNMTPYFEQACRFIEEARQSNGSVLVHCACGVSRSTTLCCAYLIKHHSMSIEQAIIQLRLCRHIVQPNTGFLRQLIRFNEQVECDKTNIDKIIGQIDNL